MAAGLSTQSMKLTLSVSFRRMTIEEAISFMVSPYNLQI